MPPRTVFSTSLTSYPLIQISPPSILYPMRRPAWRPLGLPALVKRHGTALSPQNGALCPYEGFADETGNDLCQRIVLLQLRSDARRGTSTHLHVFADVGPKLGPALGGPCGVARLPALELVFLGWFAPGPTVDSPCLAGTESVCGLLMGRVLRESLDQQPGNLTALIQWHVSEQLGSV